MISVLCKCLFICLAYISGTPCCLGGHFAGCKQLQTAGSFARDLLVSDGLQGQKVWQASPCQRAALKMHLLFCPAGKEYARADSRFASRDALMLAQETITAVLEGPLCFIILWGMLNDAVSQNISCATC